MYSLTGTGYNIIYVFVNFIPASNSKSPTHFNMGLCFPPPLPPTSRTRGTNSLRYLLDVKFRSPVSPISKVWCGPRANPSWDFKQGKERFAAVAHDLIKARIQTLHELRIRKGALNCYSTAAAVTRWRLNLSSMHGHINDIWLAAGQTFIVHWVTQLLTFG